MAIYRSLVWQQVIKLFMVLIMNGVQQAGLDVLTMIIKGVWLLELNGRYDGSSVSVK